MKTCISYLIKSSAGDVYLLNKSLATLEKNLLPNTKVDDILIYHEEDFEEFKHSVKCNHSIRFERIKFSVPDHNKKFNILESFPHPSAGNKITKQGTVGFSMGYRHMCRFWSGAIYNQPSMQEYDYYIRLDNDSFIMTKINYDVFHWAHKNNICYSYIEPAITKDSPKVIEGLWPASKEFMSHEIEEAMMFYTNFELGSVYWFLKSGYMDFFNHLDKKGGFYTARWGDAPVKYLGVNLLADPKRVKPIRGFTYRHGKEYKC
jgi:hypothetical protein